MEDFQKYLDSVGEYGIVTEVNYPIAKVSGLPYVKPNEIVVFENGDRGEVFSIDGSSIDVLLFSKESIKAGMKLARTDKFISVSVGEALLGSIVDPLGNLISQKNDYNPTETWEIEKKFSGISSRSRIKKSLITGVSLVDLLIPLGQGQKELVIGDRKTGKTSFLLSVMKQQQRFDSVIVYAAIGKKRSDIKKIEEYLQKEKLAQNTVVVATAAHDSPSLIYLTPYSAMTIAEYFRNRGRDVVIILDDLSTHAKFYREISLLAKRFPGRDSYPGDIFYIHARLLERTGNFKSSDGREISITCLPVVETIEGDLTGYIATNIMGMTDGHIYFDSNAFYKGRRPAINVTLSVTRVGRQTQSKLGREINRELTAFLTQYERIQNFSHFGAELSAKVQNVLKTGDLIYRFFDQHYNDIVPLEIELTIFALIWSAYLGGKLDVDIIEVREKLLKNYDNPEVGKLLQSTTSVASIHDLLLEVVKAKDQLFSICSINKIS